MGAVISGLVAASVVIAYLAGAEVNGERPPILQVIPSAVLMGVMSYGLWRARYWAVLGLPGRPGAADRGSDTRPGRRRRALGQLAGNLALIAIAGTLFYFMIKAMARIQMPERAPRE